MRIAVDAMGGDFAPRETVRGAVRAAAELDSATSLILVGREQAIRDELRQCGGTTDRIGIHNADEVVEMGESPALAVRRKRDSSIGCAVDLVKQGRADAIVSAGNTGAVVVAATLKLRTLTAVERPAIAAIIPTRGRPAILVDAGANTDCSARLLAQFAVMGSVYSRCIMGRQHPVVGLLSIGGEELKGNEATRAAFGLLNESHLTFRGNVEGRDLFLGDTDVVACDGFVGNVVLKTSESAGHAMGHWMKKEFTRNPWRVLGAAMLAGALRSLRRRMDPESYGGAPLLGVNGVCIIAHGASSSRAIYHAIRVAGESIHHHLNEQIAEEVSQLGSRDE